MRKSEIKRLDAVMSTPPAAMPGQRIGLMGGTFNPPHEGHLVAARTALRRLRLDKLWWVVSPGNPLKSHRDLAPLAERMAASRALASDPAIEVTDFEAGLGSPYTYATIKFLRRRYPHVRFVWVMGADNLATFERWQHWRRIADLVPIAVVDRPGWRLRALASPAGRYLARRRLPESAAPLLPGCKPPAWVFLTARLSGASSTALRSARAG
jgi:nicotinate-nucleotide adenylyltransferase